MLKRQTSLPHVVKRRNIVTPVKDSLFRKQQRQNNRIFFLITTLTIAQVVRLESYRVDINIIPHGQVCIIQPRYPSIVY